MNLHEIDIRALREAVQPKLTQRELADRIGVDQSVISRAEANPASMSVQLLFNICTAFGMTLDEVVGGVLPQHGLSMEVNPNAYADLENLAKLIRNSIVNDQEDLQDRDLPGPKDSSRLSQILSRKPQVVITGPFDAGKSTLVNVLLNDHSIAPVGYSPTTNMVTFLRHLKDRPAWCNDDVLFLKAGFEPERWTEEEHVKKNLVLAGPAGMLREHGSHGGGLEGASTALVFHEADILRTCVLVDTPGDDHDDEDTSRTRVALENRPADVLIYMSPLTGFFSSTQMLQFERRLQSLADLGSDMAGRNLFVVLSHASPAQITTEKIPALLDGAVERFCRHLGLDVADVAGPALRSTSASVAERKTDELVAVLRSRMFPFYRGTTDAGLSKIHSRGQAFLDDLARLLSTELPDLALRRARHTIDEYCTTSLEKLEVERSQIVQMEAESAAAEGRIADLEAQHQDMKSSMNDFRRRLGESVRRHRRQSVQSVDELMSKEVNERVIEEIIRRRYSKQAMSQRGGEDKQKGAKKLAQEEMPGLMVKRFTTAVERDLEHRGRAFADELDTELADLQIDLGRISANGSASIPLDLRSLDLRGAFIGGAMSGVAVGALALWASTLGNLGAYIIAAQAAGWLAALGISLPAGGATLTAAMAAVGGPVGVAIAILAIGVLVGMQFRDDWQTRLAKNITRALHAGPKKGQPSLREAVGDSVNDFWTQTGAAVKQGVDAMEEAVEQQLNHWRRLLDPQAAETRSRRLTHIDTIQPWMTWLKSIVKPQKLILS